MNYKPSFDTKIQTRTLIQQQTTWHTDYIDWNYPFHHPENSSHFCTNEQGKKERIDQQISYLKQIEAALKDGKEVRSSTYGGWPRIYSEVLKIGMCSCWPFWKPRPTVLVYSTLGSETQDWNSITGVWINAKES